MVGILFIFRGLAPRKDFYLIRLKVFFRVDSMLFAEIVH
jgi:hypothetical protein